jgi:hypothetical protein
MIGKNRILGGVLSCYDVEKQSFFKKERSMPAPNAKRYGS